MKVKIGNKVYQMSRQKFKKMLEIGSEQVPFGIYAVSRGDYAEMLNIRAHSTTQLKRDKRNFERLGYKVYYNDK